MNSSEWSNLEIIKLVASLFVPIILAIVGIYIHRVTKRFEHNQWRSQKLIEKRLSIYDEIAPLMNDLLCYFTYVGAWRDMDPPDVVALKRTLDKKIYLAAPLYSEDFFLACIHFQECCYSTYNGWGEDATLRTSFLRRSNARASDWEVEWESCFSQEATEISVIRESHQRVMQLFSRDIGVHKA